MSNVESEAFPCPPSLIQEAAYIRLWLEEEGSRCPFHQVGRVGAALDWVHRQQNCDWHFDLEWLKESLMIRKVMTTILNLIQGQVKNKPYIIWDFESNRTNGISMVICMGRFIVGNGSHRYWCWEDPWSMMASGGPGSQYCNSVQSKVPTPRHSSVRGRRRWMSQLKEENLPWFAFLFSWSLQQVKNALFWMLFICCTNSRANI